MKELSFTELKEIKSILETRIKHKYQWMIAERGYNYKEYCRRELIYHNDENHEKLKRVNQQIEDIINNI